MQTFADEFDTFKPWWPGVVNPTWRTEYKDGFYGKTHPFDNRTLPSNKEAELYLDPSMPGGINPFKIVGGMLEITADLIPEALQPQLRNFKYSSGVITTQPSHNQLYGYFEARVKIPRGKGLWPAFWLLPTDLDWPPEIDVMESIGDPTVAFYSDHSKTGLPSVTVSGTITDNFHVFAVAWDPVSIIWYVDGKEVARIATPWDHTRPMYMLLNLGVGGEGSWPGAPDASTVFPAKYVIDYVRAYQFADLKLP